MSHPTRHHVSRRVPLPPELRARMAALKTFNAVRYEGAFMGEALGVFGQHLDPRDRAFAHALVGAAVRHAGAVDALLSRWMSRPLDAGSNARAVLHLGLTQMLFLDGVAPHAAVDTTVDLMKRVSPKLAGVANAVLRNAQRDDKAALNALPPHINLPGWVVDKIQADWGPRADAVLAALLGRAALDVRLRDTTLADTLAPLGAPLPVPGAWRLKPELTPAEIPGLADGRTYVQDMAAQLPARHLAEGLTVGGPVLDLCAAPGGKTLQLADLMPERVLVAVERDAARLPSLTDNLRTAGLSVPVVQADGNRPPFAPRTFAGVLLDAPCTALGTTRRHPEALFHRTPDDVARAVRLQRGLLDAAAELVAVGGCLVYATCSPFKAEGEEQAAWFLARHPAFERQPMTGPGATPDGDLRTLPDDGMDAFFTLRLRRLR